MARLQAVILAAGTGSRLGDQTEKKPKCLIEIGGKPIITHQLEALADHGVGPVLIVLGHEGEQIRAQVGDAVEYIVNRDYKETNSLYSLWLARSRIKPPFVLLNSDLLFHPDILDRVLSHGGSVLAYDSTSISGREKTKVAVRNDRILDLGKDLPVEAARGESLGLLKFDHEGAEALLKTADHLVAQGHQGSWVIEATRTVCSNVPVTGVNVAGLPWVEVDFPYDLDQARREVWPTIEAMKSRRSRRWRRYRYAAIALATLIFAGAGWLSSTRVGPASVDWESVAPLAGEAVSLQRAKGPQRWWYVASPDSLVATLDSVKRVRVEIRLLLGQHTLAPGRYVVEVTANGRDTFWQVFKATPDSSVAFTGFVVGDRDRFDLELNEPAETLTVKLLAGTASQALVRIRRPE